MSVVDECMFCDCLTTDVHSYVQTDMGGIFAEATGVEPPLTAQESAAGVLKQVKVFALYQ